MKCCKHYDRDAIAQCRDCRKGLCPECTEKWSIPICDNCNLNRAKNEKRAVLKNIVLIIPFFILGFSLLPISVTEGFSRKLMMGYMLAGLPWGWSALNKVTPNIFLMLPLAGWFLYFFIKFSISLLIGWIILPYKLFVFATDYKKAQGVQKQINDQT